MLFYKIIQNQNYVGVSNENDFLRFQLKHRVLLVCKWELMQYIRCNGKLYHARWMKPAVDDSIEYELADVIPITEDEYNILYEARENKELLEVLQEDTTPIEEVQDVIDTTYVDGLKATKIQSMSRKCNEAIVAGFDIVLSDGVSHHFDLTTEDQLNLFEAAMLINQGEEAVSYHASGETYKFYGADDMKLIISEASNLRKYHTAYFNSLKGYINSLTNIEDVAAINYGDLIPAEYMSDVLKSLI